METCDKYRFTLQWRADTPEKIHVGELLKTFGNHKSDFIVMVIADYLRSHPEALSSGPKLKYAVEPGLTCDQIEVMVNALIDKRLAGNACIRRETTGSGVRDPIVNDDIDAMLENLDLFTQ